MRGWQRSGKAFNNQPTFGDNTLYRPVRASIRTHS